MTRMTTTIDGRADPYPSRVADDATITPRLDPVVHGVGDGPLAPALVDSYARDGFVVVESVFDPDEIDAVNVEIDRLAADASVKATPQAVLEPEGAILRSVFEVHRHAGPLGSLARDRRLADVARQLLGSEVYVHQSRVNLKPGFHGREFAWHSDFETWHTEDGMPRMRALSCSISLTENHPWNGPLLTIAGSHQWYVSCVGKTPERHYEQSLRSQQYGTPDDDSLAELCRRGRIEQCLGPPGTVVFFDCNLMHGSNSNITPHPRRNMFVVYNSVENALEDPFAAPAPRPEHIASRDFTPIR
jgi:ectoine hydroxylase